MKLLFILLFISILTDIVNASNKNYTKKSIETPNSRIKRDIEDKPPHTPNPNKPTSSPIPTHSPTMVPTPVPTPAPTNESKGGFLIFI